MKDAVSVSKSVESIKNTNTTHPYAIKLNS